MAVSAVALYCVLFPSGLWGKPIKGFLATAFGFGRYFVPLLTGYVGLRLSLSRPWPQGVLRTVLWTSLFFFGISFVSLFSEVAYHTNAGGVVGLAGAAFLSRLFGTPGAWLVSLLAMGLLLAAAARVSPVVLAEKILVRLRADWDEWKHARQEGKPRRESVVKPRAVVASPPPPARSAPPPVVVGGGAIRPVLSGAIRPVLSETLVGGGRKRFSLLWALLSSLQFMWRWSINFRRYPF